MESKFYKKAADYWSKIPATLEGVLGGFGFISNIDIDASKKFLDQLYQLENPPQKNISLDCGAGIGRITKDLLINIYDKVELVEQNADFLKEAEITIQPKAKLGRMYPVGLQNFETNEKYDVIWCQWVLGHLTDRDFVKFFIKCKNSLRPNGVIVVKENVTSSGHLERDEIDSSVTRSLEHLLSLLKKSHLMIIQEYKQDDFPVGIYPVYMFALRPDSAVENSSNTNVYASNISREEMNGSTKTSNVPLAVKDLVEDIKYITIQYEKDANSSKDNM